jgi:O-methyltransferase
MMKSVNKLVKIIVSALGYEVHKKQTSKNEVSIVRFEVFINLANAYELLLNNSSLKKVSIKPDKVRPKLLSRLAGTLPSEAYFLIHALASTELVNGDVCEFGVAQGETSALIANEIADRTTKTLHLFDSFEGLPRPSDKDRLKDDIFSLGNMSAYAGTMKCAEDMVLRRLAAISFSPSRFIIHKGFIENLIHTDQNLPGKVSFAYVDFDFYEPIKIALNFLHSVTTSGSIIIVDDYDFFSTGVKEAVDEFLSDKNFDDNSYDFFVPDTRFGYFAILTKL